MSHIWRFRIAFALIVGGLATWAWAETIEFVTYYPAPTAQGSSNVQAMAVGNGYEGVTPDDGELLVFDRIGIGPGFDVAQPAPRLDISEGAVRITMDAAADPAQQLLIRGATDNGRMVSLGYNTAGNYASLQSYNGGAPAGNLFLQRQGGVVGIGTWAAATGKLVVVGAIADAATNNIVTDFQSGAANSMLKVSGTTASVLLGTDTNGDAVTGSYTANRNLRLWAGNAERVRVTSAGSVGIGTTNPVSRLNVYEPNPGVWATQIQGNQYGLYSNAQLYSLYGQATSTGGIGTFGYNSAYGAYGGFGWGTMGAYAYTPQANWGGYFQGATYGLVGVSSAYWGLPLYAYNAGSGYWSYLAYGYFGLYTNGYVAGRGFQYVSSIERKKNVSVLSRNEEASILSTIEKLPLVHYQFKEMEGPNPSRIGLVAEWSPEEIKPLDGKSIDLASYVTYSIAGVKALSAQVKSQQEQIQQLNDKVERLQSR